MSEKQEKKLFTLAELAEHNTKQSLYVSIKGKVYDVTKFIDEHPGGEEVLLDEAGRDATEAFEDVGHSDEAHGLLKGFEIGELKEGAPPQPPKNSTPPSYPKQPQPESSSSLVSYLLPIAVLVAFIAYKYVSE
ncbi:cytochrome b5-like heme/steroid binding domain-containing protein [Glomus cerebriforme]|uniref:Cytochrome b5-like heme/steroid binding domain-containing protein n=1 Tax=Glomus cerebriforme TaxID=658196 RepID=A0A397TMG0_9GLOM|nr:cytochrome b5-like heme/steroid binding domain-containing protein [Glomus cerebriforme]